MQSTTPDTAAAITSRAASYWSKAYPHDFWMEAQGVPIHRGYYIEDLRTLELGLWKEHNTKMCFVQLEGMQGICEARVSEIPAGQSLDPIQLVVVLRALARPQTDPDRMERVAFVVPS